MWPFCEASFRTVSATNDGDTRRASQRDYAFRFDADLVEECRTQLVRVTAPGYRTQWVSIVVSSRIRSNDVLLEPGQ